MRVHYFVLRLPVQDHRSAVRCGTCGRGYRRLPAGLRFRLRSPLSYAPPAYLPDGLQATRKPRLKSRDDGSYQLRFADRQSLAG